MSLDLADTSIPDHFIESPTRIRTISSGLPLDQHGSAKQEQGLPEPEKSTTMGWLRANWVYLALLGSLAFLVNRIYTVCAISNPIPPWYLLAFTERCQDTHGKGLQFFANVAQIVSGASIIEALVALYLQRVEQESQRRSRREPFEGGLRAEVETIRAAVREDLAAFSADSLRNIWTPLPDGFVQQALAEGSLLGLKGPQIQTLHQLVHNVLRANTLLGTIERLGHSQIAFTLDTYSHVLPSMGKEAASRLDALLAPSSPPASIGIGLSRSSVLPS